MDRYLIYLILGIVIITGILYYVVGDFYKVIDLSSKITLLTGLLLVIIGYLFRFIVLNYAEKINLENAINVVVNKFLITSIYLIFISILEQVIVRIIPKKRII